MAEKKVTYNYCMGTGCHEICVLTTNVEDGRIVNTQRTVCPSTGKPINEICQKGIVYSQFPEHPTRLKYPLKRVGERGEGKFEQISWDQALDEISDKLAKIRDEMGPEAVLINNFASSYPGVFTALAMPLIWRFVHVFGASLLPWNPVDCGIVWGSIINYGTFFGVASYDAKRMHNADLIIITGAAPLGWTMAGSTSRDAMKAKENGAKLVTFGTVFDSTAALSDEFIAVKPATDVYIGLAMANILFRDNLIDKDFLAKYTVAPFLVRKDNGKFLRESEIIEDGNPGKYVIWNTSPAIPVGVEAHSQVPEDYEADIFAEPVINGIACSTALVNIRNEVEECTPQAQEEFTGVPAATIERITHEYVNASNPLLWMSAGLRYQNAGPAYRALQLLPILSGKFNKGEATGLALGGQMGEYPVSFNELPLVFPDGDPTTVKGAFPLTFGEMFDAGFPYKALLNLMGNPLQTYPNTELWTKRVLPKLDLIVTHEVRMTDTGRWSDYVLPDTTTFERYELSVRGGNLILCEPAIKPAGDVKGLVELFKELSKRLGFGEYFDKTEEEWLQIRLQTEDPAIASVDPPITWERLKKEKIIPLNLPEEPFNVWERMDFPSDSGRIEIYSEHLAETGQAVAKYFDPVIYGPKSKKYPLQFYVGRHRVFVQSQFSEFDSLRQIAGEKPFARINRKDAVQRGIKDGDLIEIFNDRGSFRITARVTEGFYPHRVLVYLAYPYKDFDGDPPQALMEPLAVPEREDLLMKTTHKYLRSHMPFPATMDMEMHIPVGWETMWDNVCDIRKV